MDKISVIVPAYKSGPYIFNLLECLSNQTLDDSRYRVLIVLNGVKEPYYSDIAAFIKNYSNFQLQYIVENGVSKARNFGLKNSTEKYVTFIDDDDYVSLNFLEVLLNGIEKNNTDVVQSNFKTDTNGIIGDDYISKAFVSLSDKEFSIYSYRKFLSSVCGKIYKRSIFDNFIFNENLKISEDSVFLFSISRNINNIILSTFDCIYFRNIRFGSALRSNRTILEILNNYFYKIYIYSKIYFSDIRHYNFIFYISRLFAISKVLLLEFFGKFRQKIKKI